MVSIKKFLLFAVLASVLIGAVCVKAEEASKEPAKEEEATAAAEKPAAEGEAAQAADGAQGGVADFGKKIISGFKKAGKTIFSHIPFFSQGEAKKAEGAEESSEASAEGAAAPAEEASKEESKEKSA